MTTYVAFLRGVNLGPHRAVAMPRLAEIGRELGYADVWTYVNSGNLVLTSGRSSSTVEQEVARALREEYATDVDVIVRSVDELRAVLAGNPFPDDPPGRVTVAFLSGEAPAGVEERIAAAATAAEPFEVGGREVWVHYGDGQARSRLGANLSRVVGVSATTRTVGTLDKVVATIGSRAAPSGA